MKKKYQFNSTEKEPYVEINLKDLKKWDKNDEIKYTN